LWFVVVSPDISSGRLSIAPLRARGFSQQSDSSLRGIISHQISKCDGNVRDLGVVSVSVSGDYQGKRCEECGGSSENETNSWLCHDFKDIQVVPTHCSILSFP
jgi:hypothetical protein